MHTKPKDYVAQRSIRKTMHSYLEVPGDLTMQVCCMNKDYPGPFAGLNIPGKIRWFSANAIKHSEVYLEVSNIYAVNV